MPSGSVPPFRPPLLSRLQAWWAGRVDRSIGWDKLPRYTGGFVLAGLRTTLRRRNLVDTTALPVKQNAAPIVKGDRYLTTRTTDGTFNDLDVPGMGSAGARFGRNVPLERTYPEPDHLLLTPSPRTVSRQLMTRDRFIPASSLNLLAAAWLQFMVHDWLSHGKSQKHDPWRIELDPEDPWPHRPMQILRTRRDPTRPDNASGSPPTFANVATHWWDASQLYGSDAGTEATVREGAG